VTYFADNQGRRAWRSSVWRLTEAGWRMYFHQGTLVAQGVEGRPSNPPRDRS